MVCDDDVNDDEDVLIDYEVMEVMDDVCVVDVECEVEEGEVMACDVWDACRAATTMTRDDDVMFDVDDLMCVEMCEEDFKCVECVVVMIEELK